MISQLDSIQATLTPEMTAHAARWNGTLTEWQNNMDTLRNFILTRCNNMSTGLMSCYSLTGPYNITLNADPVGSGTVRLNTMVHDQLPWTGTYFGGMDNILEATPIAPYLFKNWTSPSQVFNPNDSTALVTVNLTAGDSITAHFDYTTAVFPITGEAPVANMYPTVVSDHTVLDFSLQEPSPVTIQLFDINGKLIQTFADGHYMQTGFHSMTLNIPQGSIPNGIYMIKFSAGKANKSFKMVYTN
jgi:hypothetical protein